MAFIKANTRRLLLAGSLAAVTAFTVTACGGASAATTAQGSPGHWTQTEINEFTAAADSGGSGEDSCIIGYFERDMSFTNAMAVGSVESASGGNSSASQVRTALISKYGTAEGDAIDAQFAQVLGDSVNNCNVS